MIEAGSDNRGRSTIAYPSLFLANILPDSTNTTFHVAQQESQLADREVVVPVGGVLGGGSSINLMMYSRPQKSDLDAWDVEGWSGEEMLPYLNKVESYHGPDPHGRHGHDGPVVVSRGPYIVHRAETEFIQAVEKVGAGNWKEMADLQKVDGKSVDGVQRAYRFVSDVDGKRQDAASGYLFPRLGDGEHANLHVLLQTKVVRVLFDEDKTAVGVDVVSSSGEGGVKTIKARKMVILSAGAFGSPAILERSGIGNPEILAKTGVTSVVSDLPGVGEQYNDHQLMTYAYYSSLDPQETLDRLVGGRLNLPELMQRNDPILGWNGQDATCKLRPSEEEVAQLGDKFKELWDRDFKDKIDRALVVTTLLCL